MKKESINVAIIGYGLSGSVFHAPLIKSTPGLSVNAIVARSNLRQEQAKKDFPAAQIYSSYDDLLQNSERIDLVVIATPNKEHAGQAIKAMKAGLAVVVDKPLAISSRECDELINTSVERGVLLSVFQNRRWDNDFLTVRKLLADNALGAVTRFESRFERYRPMPRPDAWRETSHASEGGGLLFDLGSHLIDQAVHLFGEPQTVFAEIEKRRNGVNADDDCFLALSFRNGVHAHLWMSAIAPIQGPRFRVSGLNGAYEKYGLDPQEEALRAGQTPDHPEWGKEPTNKWGRLLTQQNGALSEKFIETENGAYQTFYALMRESIINNGPVPVPPQDARHTSRIIEAARRSVEQKESVSFTQFKALSL